MWHINNRLKINRNLIILILILIFGFLSLFFLFQNEKSGINKDLPPAASPLPVRCGDALPNSPTCPPEYTCGPNPDFPDKSVEEVGGICVHTGSAPLKSKEGERCNEFSETSKDCEEGLICELDNPRLPDLGGVCVKN